MLEEHGIQLLRDRDEIRYKDPIRDFMLRLGRGKAVVAVISESYLKSKNCMFEMLEISRAGALRERIFPIVLPDAQIYEPLRLVEYIGYWEERTRKLDEGLKKLRGERLTNLQEQLNRYADVRQMFDSIADTLQDMNALTLEQHEGSGFEDLIRRIRAQVG